MTLCTESDLHYSQDDICIGSHEYKIGQAAGSSLLGWRGVGEETEVDDGKTD